jgi:uncharacterized membrane protein
MSDAIETTMTARKQRIIFIDVIRAFAILMMLQGHFIDAMLLPEYRDYTLPLYAFWAFFRGLTAPIFFFSTGLVFMYLLLKDERPLLQNERVHKGLRRVAMLIALGYLLKWSLPSLLRLRFYPSFFLVDVLHCIGFAILGLITVYALHRWLQFSLRVILFTLAIVIFLSDPILKATDWSVLPRWVANYFTTAHGSTFTLFPWVGYTFMGGVLGVWFNRNKAMAFAAWFPWALVALGWSLHAFSTHWMAALYEITAWNTFYEITRNNHLLMRLGHVFIAVAAVVWITRWWKTMPSLVTKIGSETLTIYAVHYVILYGTWFNFGLVSLWRQQLHPMQAALGALLFVISFVVMTAHIEAIRLLLYRQLPAMAHYTFRVVRVKTIRFYLRARRPVRRIWLAFN